MERVEQIFEVNEQPAKALIQRMYQERGSQTGFTAPCWADADPDVRA